MTPPILFYDIPSQVEGSAWSPNTWKTRLTLNVKSLPYKTIWVEYPDIAKVCQEIGAAPTAQQNDGSPEYTLPAIYDPSTDRAISDSANIVRYLDGQYPSTYTLIPEGTSALHEAFRVAFQQTVQRRTVPLIVLQTNNMLNPRSKDYFRRTREVWFGKLEKLSPPGPIRERHWSAFEEGLSTVAEWMLLEGADKPFFMGDQMCYVDVTLAAWLLWFKAIFGHASEEWARILQLDGGRWERFIQAFEKYADIN